MTKERAAKLKAELKDLNKNVKSINKQYQLLDREYRNLDKESDSTWKRIYKIEDQLLAAEERATVDA